MQRDLAEHWGVEAAVLYDRPPNTFRPITLAERQQLLDKLAAAGMPTFRNAGPATPILVSSTSWTEDEDFSVLLAALVGYEAAVKAGRINLPRLLVVITGKGPQKERYLAEIERLGLLNVDIVTPWLESQDYPVMLGAASLGVCLHTSSSGLDLPMKVVDMFGCGLPVAAVAFPALPELVQDGVNGKVFHNSTELAEIIIDWFTDFPTAKEDHLKFRENLVEFRSLGWEENWDRVALPVFNKKTVRTDRYASLFLVCLGVIILSMFAPTVL